jgi:single-strand DNA-binding protein
MGRLTADPDYRQTPQGTPVCKFRIAVNKNYVSKETGKREADFINVEAWRGTADLVARYFKKGKPIIVEGSLTTNDYTDQNGIRQYRTFVQASNIHFCLTDSSANNNNDGYGNYGSPYQQGGYNNGNYQGGYAQQNGNSYYQQPQQQPPAPPVYQQPVNNVNSVPVPTVPNGVPNNVNVAPPTNSGDDLQTANLEDFEEILSDGEIPF